MSVLEDLGLVPFFPYDDKNRLFIFADIIRTMPGLPQSGFYSQQRLIAHLATGGYYQTFTPMLLRHETRDIDFTLVVGDFGVKYKCMSDY